MAKASKKVVETVTLELSPDEARALRFVYSRISGNEETSPRKHIKSVSKALNAIGYSRWDDFDGSDLVHGNLSFDDYKEDANG
jgi:hypothetical protein